jgi:hypothetical protein
MNRAAILASLGVLAVAGYALMSSFYTVSEVE